jgi:hypothetical protein
MPDRARAQQWSKSRPGIFGGLAIGEEVRAAVAERLIQRLSDFRFL